MTLSSSLSSPMALSSILRFSSAFLRPHHHQRHSPFPGPSSRRFLSLPPSPPHSPPSRSGNDSETSIAVVNNHWRRVVSVQLQEEMTDSYITHSVSVRQVSLLRALPDVRDGLKRLDRNILFAMHELGLSSTNRFKKCVTVVGKVVTKIFQYGYTDTAMYDSLLRMAQDFSIRYPLIQGYGNLGTIDEDPPAAMRYTACRLDPLAEAMLLTDLELDTVKDDLLQKSSLGIKVHMATNIRQNLGELLDELYVLIHHPEATDDKRTDIHDYYEEYLDEVIAANSNEKGKVKHSHKYYIEPKEPSFLPARLPNLLLNGSFGIAVGMATNIPPHNLGELVDVFCALIHNPKATLQELLEYMPGPDFPTRGLIIDNQGILDAYRTGRGCIVVRGKTNVELLDSKTKRMAIVIKEIPYQVNKPLLVRKIAGLVKTKSLDGISAIRDESGRCGMRIVIELKRGADPSIVLNNLYRLTSLQSSFSCNMVCMLDGQPKLMGLKDILQAFLDFRCFDIERRARLKISQLQDRMHIVEGMMVGGDDWHHLVDILRKFSGDALLDSLKNEFKLSEKQARATSFLRPLSFHHLERSKLVN